MVTFSCFHRMPLLEAPGAKETVEAVLEQTRARHRARIYAYVLMPEHVHLLINEPRRILLAQLLKAVKQITSRKLRGPRDKFWQDRYYDSNVHGEEARSEVIRYIHRNPVKRGLVENPEDWPWSSFRHYATGEAGVVEIESQWTAFRRGNQLPEHLRYAEKLFEVRDYLWHSAARRRGYQPPAHRKQRDERGTDCILEPGSEDQKSVPGPPASQHPSSELSS